MSSFYLTLPSNTINVHKHTDATDTNPQSDFRIRLPHRINLEGDWEMALVELIYPHSWQNITSSDRNDSYITLDILNASKKLIGLVIPIPTGYYESPSDLIETVNKLVDEQRQMLKLTSAINFVYEPGANRVSFKTVDLAAFHMAEKIQYILGFERKSYTNLEKVSKITAKYPVDLRGGFESLYLYCDLVQNQIVGNALVPLLRVVTVDGKYDDIICKTFDSPHYVPLAKHEIDTVEINIKDDENRFVNFLYGKVVVKIHFRKQKLVL